MTLLAAHWLGAAETDVLKVICFGDSITGQPNLKRYLKWSSVLECMLDARLGDPNAMVLNRGIGGDTTSGACKRLAGDVLDLKPDIVVILLGGNDAQQGVDPAKVRENLETIVRACRKIDAKVLLMQYHVLPNPESPDTAWVKLADNNQLIADVATAEGVPVLDMHAPMERALKLSLTSELAGRKDGVADWRSVPLVQEHLVNAKDGVHLNSAGELVFAKTVFRKLDELGWIKK